MASQWLTVSSPMRVRSTSPLWLVKQRITVPGVELRSAAARASWGEGGRAAE